MTEKLKIVFETLDYFNSFNTDKTIRLLIFKNNNYMYDINIGIGNDIAYNEKITRDDNLINKDSLIKINNINLMELNYILFIINMKYVIETSIDDRSNKIVRFQSIKNRGKNSNTIEILFNRNILKSEYLNQHLKGTHRNSHKYAFWGFYDRTDEELQEISSSLEMGEEIDLTSIRMKNKMKDGYNNTTRTYDEYYKMLSFFILKMYANSIELAYSYSYNEYLELLKNQHKKDINDIDFGNTNMQRYYKKYTIEN